MASDINTVTVVGRLTRDVELKRTQGGTAIADMSIASNYRTKRGDNWEDAVSFFDCVLMGKRAEGLAQYLTKGTRLGVTGELRQDRWEKDGEKRSKVKVNVRDVQLLGSKESSGQQQESQMPSSDTATFEDDVPF
jgi:single-strand DNA-binding protein